MIHLVADCLRCGSRRITFDAMYVNIERRSQARKAEVYAECRSCHSGSIFKMYSKLRPGTSSYFPIWNMDFSVPMNLNDVFEVVGTVTIKDENLATPPEHLPDEIQNIYREASICLNSECCNAACAMYRLILDKVTKHLLESALASQTYELNHEKRSRLTSNLASRLSWLIDQQLVPLSLKELSTCIKDDGNDGAHDGNLTKREAEDLHDFTDILLYQIYTVPKQLEIATQRRLERRNKLT